MNIDQLIEQVRAGMKSKLDDRAEQRKVIDDIREACNKDQRDPSEDEATKVRAAQDKITQIDADLETQQARVKDLSDEKDRDDAASRLATEIRATGTERKPYDQVARIGQEKRTYSPDADPKGSQFLSDVGASFLGDPEARDRVVRHMQEERVERGEKLQRAAGTGAFAGLTVPQYLTDLYAPAAAAARPFANICTHHDLPAQGMTINLSRITTATSTAAQSSENSAVSETNIDDTLLTENVLTVAGQQTLSRQAIERGTGTEDVTVNDLIRRYHTALDSKLINDATTGMTNVAQTVAYTDASPTAAELWPKVLNAQANLEGVMLDLGVDSEYAVMHSRRWAWMQSQVGSTWPFIAQPGIPTQAGGVNNGLGYGEGVRGVLPNGTRVIVDNNIGTTLGAGTEDEIYVVNSAECHLWEDPSAPLLIRAEQPNAASLGVLFVVYGYFAYTFRRYTNGHQKIAGTGLIAPTF